MDWHRLDVDGIAVVTVTADHPPALGRVGLSVQHEIGTCGEAAEMGVAQTDGQLQRECLLGGGRYLLPVGGVLSAVLPYDLTIASRAVQIPFDFFEYPDSINRNDGFATAYPFTGLIRSEANATIDPATDIDFYRVVSNGGFSHPILGTLATRFSITTAHMPVAIALYGAAGALLATAASGPNCDPMPSVDIPAGTHYVRVTGSTAGIYKFVLRERYVAGRLFDMRAFWRVLLDPSGPVQIFVREPDERYAFVFDPLEHQIGELALASDSLHVTLLDIDGNVLDEGRTNPFGEGPRTETVSLAGLLAGETYVLEFSRLDEIDFSSAAAPPALEGELSLR